MVWLIIDACSFVGKKVQKARPEVKSLDFAGLLTWDLHNFCVETKNTLVVKWWQIHCRCDVDSGEWDMNAVNLALMSVSWCLEVGISISISIYLSIYLYIYIYIDISIQNPRQRAHRPQQWGGRNGFWLFKNSSRYLPRRDKQPYVQPASGVKSQRACLPSNMAWPGNASINGSFNGKSTAGFASHVWFLEGESSFEQCSKPWLVHDYSFVLPNKKWEL